MGGQQSHELWTRPVPELKYLNADNVARYRLIMRYFYDNHSKLKYWLNPEEVYDGVTRFEILDGYSLEQCQRDLDALTEWGNLSSRHDGGRALTIADYLRKRFRYQMTPYAIEIERMLASLTQIQGFGGSLEPTLLERLYAYIAQIREQSGRFAEGNALLLWRDVQSSFRQLHESASDYLASLQTGRAEELMQTSQFLLYKDTLTHYLRNFILGLQQFGGQLEGVFRETALQVWDDFLEAVALDEGRLPILDEPLSDDERRLHLHERWDILRQWFVGRGDEWSDIRFLEQATKDTIARVVRYALAIQERERYGISRKRELDHLGQWFFRLEDVDHAHELAAHTYGLFRTRHLQGQADTVSDSADLSLWEETPMLRTLRSRSRIQRRRSETDVVADRSNAQAAARGVILAQRAEEQALVWQWVQRGSFAMSDLDLLMRPQRLLLLGWISRCLQTPSRTIRTPDGLQITLRMPDDAEPATLACEDGDLELPNFHVTLQGAIYK